MADYGQNNIPKDLPSEAIPISLLSEGLFLHIKYFLLFLRAVLIIEFLESKTLEYHIVSIASII